MNLKFHNLKDKKPKHKSRVCYIKTNRWNWEFIYADVEYVWDDLNGNQIPYSGELRMSNQIYGDIVLPCVLCISFDGEPYCQMDSQDDLLWCYESDMDKKIMKGIPE